VHGKSGKLVGQSQLLDFDFRHDFLTSQLQEMVRELRWSPNLEKGEF